MSDDNLTTFPMSTFNSTVVVFFNVSIKSYLIGDVSSLNFPRISLAKPEVRRLDLVSINDSLFKDTIVVSDTVTPSWDFQGC